MTTAERPKGIGRHRWFICGLLFAATFINYLDRQVIGLLKPTLLTDLSWSEIDYANVIFYFQAAYACGYLGAGWFVDRVGVRFGYAVLVSCWSVAEMAHFAARSVVGFSAARFALGLPEGGNFPAAIKAVGEWFPAGERALATGWLNAGSNVAVTISPFLVFWITAQFGWPAVFVVTGALGFLWLAVWLAIYRPLQGNHRVTDGERDYIASDVPDRPVKISWLGLLAYRQTWVFIAGFAIIAPVWWFYLFWVPGFLHARYHLSLFELGPPLVVIYLMADVGSIGGGWLSGRLIKRGWSVNAARKSAMLACALCVLPVFAASGASHAWIAAGLIGLAAAAHQGFSANLYTLVSDTAPQSLVASIVGFGGAIGSIAGMFAAKLIGLTLDRTQSYVLIFAVASGAYLFALLVIHLLNPRLEPITQFSAVQ